MGSQICFFEKNFLDLDYPDVTITATQGDDFAKFVRNRNLKTAWITTDSVDADNTELEFDMAAPFWIDRIILVDHNLKNYKFQKFNSTSGLWEDLFTETNDLESTTEIVLTEFLGQRLKIIVYGTKVADEDKRITRILVTRKLGQFSQWPLIDVPTLDKGKTIRKVVSGKNNILRTVGAFKCKLKMNHWRNADDLALVELLYAQTQGFEVWLGGGNETQFYYAAESYRKKDIYLMGLTNDFVPKLKGSIYVNGFDIDLDLAEVTE